MAKGDMTQGGNAAGASPQGNSIGGGQGGASKSMNDILALLSHMGVGPQNPIGQQTGMQNPQFGFNRPGAQGPMGMGQGNRNQLSGGGNTGIMGGPSFQNYHNQMMNPQGMMDHLNPNAAFAGGERRGIPMNPQGMGSLMPSRPPMSGGGNGFAGPMDPNAINKFRLQGTTRSGSNIMRDGQAVGHYGDKNQPIFNADQGGGGFPNFPGPIYDFNGQHPMDDGKLHAMNSPQAPMNPNSARPARYGGMIRDPLPRQVYAPFMQQKYGDPVLNRYNL